MSFSKLAGAFTHAGFAAADLTGKLFYLATIDTNELIALAGAGGVVLGSITEEAKAGAAASLGWGAIIQCIAAAATDEGVRVSSDGNGKAVVSSVGDFEFGTVVRGCSGANGIISVAWAPGRRHA